MTAKNINVCLSQITFRIVVFINFRFILFALNERKKNFWSYSTQLNCCMHLRTFSILTFHASKGTFSDLPIYQMTKTNIDRRCEKEQFTLLLIFSVPFRGKKCIFISSFIPHISSKEENWWKMAPKNQTLLFILFLDRLLR